MNPLCNTSGFAINASTPNLENFAPVITTIRPVGPVLFGAQGGGWGAAAVPLNCLKRRRTLYVAPVIKQLTTIRPVLYTCVWWVPLRHRRRARACTIGA